LQAVSLFLMKILVIGGGAREHAMAWKLSRERSVTGVFCAPGNPGIASVAKCIDADVGDPRALLAVAKSQSIDLTVVGPELPLSRGIVDVFTADGRAIVGPSQAAAALESSKAFAKDFMARHKVPTAEYHVCDSAKAALAWLDSDQFGYPLVLKADGLAAGKGVVIVDDRAAAAAAVRSFMLERRFGSAGDRVVFEQFLVGQEASYFVLADGTSFIHLGSAQDHKRIFDGDQGPNTGGMGAFAPSPLVTADVERRVVDEIVWPVLEGMQREGHPYRGFLYVGLMLTAEGPKVVEFNVRLGDPETQVVLPMLDEELSWLLGEAAMGALPSRSARFLPGANVCVVLAAGGYPEAVETGQPISGIDAAASVPDALVFHAGTSRREGQIVTAGGRVLTVVGRGRTFTAAIDTAYEATSRIRFEGMQFRRDIGRKALEKGSGVI
jgi:phosphoribosylamine--glycine ligase